MNLVFNVEGHYLGAIEKPYTNRETGQSGISYQISVKQGGQVGTLRTVKEVFEICRSIPDFSPCSFDCAYQEFGKNASIQVLGIHPKK